MMKRQRFLYKMGGRKVRDKIEVAKMLAPRLTRVGLENHKGSLFGMNYIIENEKQ